VPFAVHATPPSTFTIHFQNTSNIYEDYVIASTARTYAWSDSYADYGVTTVKAYALPDGGTWVSDSGRYWAEATSYASNITGEARSEAYLPSGTFAQHWRTILTDHFYNASY
jgi:hypothetical protein